MYFYELKLLISKFLVLKKTYLPYSYAHLQPNMAIGLDSLHLDLSTYPLLQNNGRSEI
jgi:hypothetical protein